MKRKVVKLSSFRLSPNEEALLIKEEHERRRRLRIKQVREQERSIAVEIREEVKHRRNQQLKQLADELNAEWQKAQLEKAKSLEKLYLCSLKEVGRGHRQAKENEPDLKAQMQQISVNRQKAEKRHREALTELKHQRDKELEDQSRYIKTRNKALLIEKKRAVRIAHLPPPPPNPLADLEVRKYPAIKMYDVDNFSVTHYHLPEPYVDREVNSKQVSARLTAEKEAKRLEELQQEAARERQEQLEKARLRGSHALQMVHLIQDREKLVKELEQMQQADLTRRRQAVAQMPPQLFEPPYRRVEIKEDRQREMEFAFEDMYAGDKKIRGDLILRLEPEPLPAPSVGTQDEDLNLSVEPEGFQKQEQREKDIEEELAIPRLDKTEVPRLASSQTSESPSKAALKKLFTKIRMQRDHCTSKPGLKGVSQDMTIESGSITNEESEQRTLTKSTTNNDVSEEHLDIQSVPVHANNQQKEVSEIAIMAGSTTLCHPKEQASRIRSEVDRSKQLHELEQQKQQQLTLIWQSEQQKQNLEEYLRKAQLQQQQAEETQTQARLSDFEKQSQQEHGRIKNYLGHQAERENNIVNEQGTQRPQAAHMEIGHPGVNPEFEHCEHPVSNELFSADEYAHKIHQYQQHLVEQNRLHKKSVEEIRKQLEEYQLKKGSSSVSTITRQQHSVPQISHHDKFAGSELKINMSIKKPEQTFVPFAQHHGFVNQFKTLEQRRPMAAPFAYLPLSELPYVNTGHSHVSPGIQVPFRTTCLPKNSENTPIFLPRRQLLKYQPVLDSALLKSIQQHAATHENIITQQQIIKPGNSSRDSRSPEDLKQKQPVVYDASNSQYDSPKFRRHVMPFNVLEMNGPETSEPCIRTSGAVDSQQGLSQVRLMEILQDQSMTQETQLRTSEISEGPSKQPMFSTTLTKRTEISSDHASSVGIRVQQEHLKELQQQLRRQRENLIATHKLQEEPIDRQRHLKELMQQQHNALEKKNIENQLEHLLLHETICGNENVEQPDPLSSVLHISEDLNTGSTQENLWSKNEDQLKNLEPATQINGALNPSWHYDSKLIHAGSNSSESPNIEVLTKEAQYYPSKPPVSKTRLGLFGLIEQHELSTIQEVESPKSDRLSMFGNKNTFSDDCYSSARELMSSRVDSSCSSEVDLSRISTSSSNSQQNSTVANSSAESIQTGRMTWREKLKLETGSFPEPAPTSRLPHYSADVGQDVLKNPTTPTCSTTSKVLFPYSWSSSALGFNAQKTPEADQVSSTTLSTGSLPLSEQLDVGTMTSGDYPSAIHDISSGQLTATSSVITSNSLSSFPANQDTVDMNQCSSKLEKCIPTESKIQQIIEKYTRNLNQLLDSSGKYQDFTKGRHISDQETSDFYLQLQSSQQNSDTEFQPLESIPNFSLSNSSASPTSSKTSHGLDTDTTVVEELSNPATNSKIESFTDSIVSTPDHERTACNIDPKEEFIQQDYNVEDGGLKPFQHLQPEITPSKHTWDVDRSGGSLRCDRTSEQGFNNTASSITNGYLPPPLLIRQGTVAAASQALESADQSARSDLTTENLRGDDGETSPKHFDSSSQLNATLCSANDGSYNISDQNGKQQEDCECITPQVITFIKRLNSNESNEVATLNDLPSEPFKLMLPEEQYCTSNDVQHVSVQTHMIHSEQLPHAKETAAIVENELEFKVEQDQPWSSKLASNVYTSENIIPVWEIESDIGIMEEPELTQLTLNDSTLVEDELGQEFPIENLTTKNELNELQAFSQASGLQPNSNTSDHTVSTLHTLTVANCNLNDKESSCQKSPTVMIFEFESPKVSNEAVLKKKHKFLANSAKRVENIKRKERAGIVKSVELHRKPTPLKQEQTLSTSSSIAAQLKMVGEVKVTTPKDRQAIEVEMRQRTLRLYSQLDEVKSRKKEVTRQLVCARNREKAKEFQKKTLEKLRAKKIHQ